MLSLKSVASPSALLPVMDSHSTVPRSLVGGQSFVHRGLSQQFGCHGKPRMVAEIGDKPASASATSERTDLVPIEKFAKDTARRFYVRPDRLVDILTSSVGILPRLASGVFVQGYKAKLDKADNVDSNTYSLSLPAGRALRETAKERPKQEKLIEIYEFEGCPFCKKVREAVTILDLDVLFYPTPQGGPTYRPKAIEMGGKKQFPYMVDPNTGTAMYESDDIIQYLATTYGNGTVPWTVKPGAVTAIGCSLALMPRLGKGSRYSVAKKPEKPLELWAYEASPFCKVVREVLCELELPHIYHSTGRGSAKRQELFERTGIFQAPYLEDPNTGVKMFESADIVDYLRKEYALSS